MLIAWRAETKTLESANVVMDCPKCKRKATPAVAFDSRKTYYLYLILPFFWENSSGVRCGGCLREIATKEPAGVLALLTPDELTSLLNPAPSDEIDLLTKFCIVISLMMFCIPFGPLLFSGLGLFATYKTRSKWRTAAIVAVIVNLLMSLWVVILIASGHF